jgi:UDP-N-acetyl-D-galactosamine dehydrogenase
MIQSGKAVKGARVLLLGLTFKENVPDIRNSKVIDIVHELAEYGVEVLIHDPVADPHETRREYGVELISLDGLAPVDAIIWAVAHDEFTDLTPQRLKELCGNNGQGAVIDVKGRLERANIEGVGLKYWVL